MNIGLLNRKNFGDFFSTQLVPYGLMGNEIPSIDNKKNSELHFTRPHFDIQTEPLEQNAGQLLLVDEHIGFE